MRFTMNRKQIVKAKNDEWGGWTLWAVFPAKFSNERIAGFLHAHCVWTSWFEWHTGEWVPCMDGEGFSRGPGQGYANGWSFRRRGSRVLVTQTGGLDI